MQHATAYSWSVTITVPSIQLHSRHRYRHCRFSSNSYCLTRRHANRQYKVHNNLLAPSPPPLSFKVAPPQTSHSPSPTRATAAIALVLDDDDERVRLPTFRSLAPAVHQAARPTPVRYHPDLPPYPTPHPNKSTAQLRQEEAVWEKKLKSKQKSERAAADKQRQKRARAEPANAASDDGALIDENKRPRRQPTIAESLGNTQHHQQKERAVAAIAVPKRTSVVERAFSPKHSPAAVAALPVRHNTKAHKPLCHSSTRQRSGVKRTDNNNARSAAVSAATSGRAVTKLARANRTQRPVHVLLQDDDDDIFLQADAIAQGYTSAADEAPQQQQRQR